MHLGAPPSFHLSMFGLTDLRQPDTLEKVLDVFESNPKFIPEYWGIDERKRLPYDRAAVIDEADISTPRQRYGTVYLWRRKSVNYFATVRASETPWIDVEFKVNQSQRAIAAAFDWANELVACFRPDIAVMSHHDMPDISDLSHEQKTHALAMQPLTYLIPVDYWELGPVGLAQHTWVGPYFIEQLTRDKLLSTPSVVCDEQDWGGIRISLGDDCQPWLHDYFDIADHRAAAMAHLEPLEIFRVATIESDRPDFRMQERKGHKCIMRSRYPLRVPPPPNPYNAN
ncbi:MAG: hypothetical protein ACPGSC_12260 [Granulosicoccaceae bacterium]